MKTLSLLRGTTLGAVTFAALLLCSIAAHASKPPRWYIVPLTPLLVEKYLACAPAVYKSSDEVGKKITGTSKADANQRRRLRFQEQSALLRQCGFPEEPHSFLSVSKSVDRAYGTKSIRLPSGTRDKDGNDVEDEATARRIGRANVAVVAPYKARLKRFYASLRAD